MHEMTLLTDVVLVLAVGVAVALALRQIGVPSIAGFILAGILVGPGVLGLVNKLKEVELLAEVGVVLLLFSIGMELSIEKVRRLWKPIVLGGSLQVGVSIGAATWLSTFFGLPWQQGLFIGFLLAASSTAIVLRGLEYRGTIDTPHGRFALGVLVFQDLCVVPMMLAIPLLAHSEETGWRPLIALAEAFAMIVVLLLASRLLVPRLLHMVARTRQRDLFVLVVLLVCGGTAWAVSMVGISLALGAFLAGLVVAGSDYRNQAMADLIPFREVLASLFFISVGMLLNPATLFQNPVPVLGILGGIVLGKFVIVLLVALIMGLPLRVAMITGMTLAHAGEFLFVLLKAAQGTSLIEETLGAQLVAAAILSMLVTPLLMYVSPKVATEVSTWRFLRWVGRRQTSSEASPATILEDHVIIAGYGVAGEELSEALKEQSIPYVIADLNAETMKLLTMQGEPAHFGDITSIEVLERLGIHRATQFVVTINDPAAALRAVSAARELTHTLPILVRVRYVAEVAPLLEAGATRVVANEFESAVEIVSQVLQHHDVDRAQITFHIEQMHSRCRAKKR